MAKYRDNLTTEQRRAKWREYSKKWRAENRERFMATTRKRNAAKRPVDRAREQAWRDKNREALRVKFRKYAKENPEINKAAVRRYQAKKRLDPEWNAYQAKKAREWRSKNREAFNIRMRKYANSRYETDANFKLRALLRARVRSVLRRKGIRKTFSALDVVGCDVQFLRGYLEARFLPGMTWGNHGEWEIDHHVPCAEFDLRDEAQRKQCFHYSNLKPMWAAANWSKGAKRPPTHQAELI